MQRCVKLQVRPTLGSLCDLGSLGLIETMTTDRAPQGPRHVLHTAGPWPQCIPVRGRHMRYVRQSLAMVEAVPAVVVPVGHAVQKLSLDTTSLYMLTWHATHDAPASRYPTLHTAM